MLQILVLKKYCGKNNSLNKIQETRVKKISENSVKNISVMMPRKSICGEILGVL